MCLYKYYVCNMCLCVYVCMYVCVCVYVCVYMCVFMYVCMYVFVCICAYMSMYVCIYVCAYIYRQNTNFATLIAKTYQLPVIMHAYPSFKKRKLPTVNTFPTIFKR